jgi:hypothetical protein
MKLSALAFAAAILAVVATASAQTGVHVIHHPYVSFYYSYPRPTTGWIGADYTFHQFRTYPGGHIGSFTIPPAHHRGYEVYVEK